MFLAPGANQTERFGARVALPEMGPGPAPYTPRRVFGAPDPYPPADLGVKKGLAAAGIVGSPQAIAERIEGWRPWRSYAVRYLWSLIE